MKRAPRPKSPTAIVFTLALGVIWAAPPAVQAQSLASTYATRDGRAATLVLGCISTDNTFTAQPCGVTGSPLHVQVDGSGAPGTPTTASGTASAQLVGVQGGGAAALPVAVSVASLPLPAGAATAANQATRNADGGSQVHLMNALPAGANTIGTIVAANRSGAWTDGSFTAGSIASVPTALAAAASRTGLHVWNVGTVTACMNYTGAAAVNGSGCAAGSLPIPAGAAYFEDQPGNVSPEAISLVCAGAACPLTIKVR